MNSMLKTSFGLVAFVFLLSAATLADAGGGGSYGRINTSSQSYPQYRAYSYESASLYRAGDIAVVAKPRAELKLADKVLATVNQGTQFMILQTQGTWVGAAVVQNGQRVAGWIAESDLSASSAPA